jgi:CheY-like chemotaxis protein
VDISAVNDPVPQPIELAVPLMLSLPRAGTVRIAVKDSGAGLSPQQLAEICAEGVQFNANELQAGQGSGLGLFISKGIVEQHGGKLVVTSEGLGKGAQFTIILPLFSIDPQDSLLGGGSSSGDITRNDLGKAILSLAGRTMTMETSMQILDLHPQRLLVVDDSALNRKMLVRLLTSKDHTCEQAEDGEVAVRKYLEMVERGEPPDAILMDYEMPVMNGPTATARLRELGCACLIVGVTGNVLPHDVAFFKERGADAVMPKPVVLEDFEHLLLQRLNAAPTASSGERGADGSVPSVEVKRKVQKSLSKPVGGRRVHVDQEVGANVLN